MPSAQESTGKQCPKCAYIRNLSDAAPEWQCPKCGIAYAKFESAGEVEQDTSPASGTESTTHTSSNSIETTDSVIAAKKFTASSLIGAVLVSLLLGYYAGREHVKYEIRSAIQESFAGFGRALSGESTQAPNLRSTEPQAPPIPKPAIITATLFDKGFRESNYRQNQYSDLLTFGIRFENIEDKGIRAFDGSFDFYDLLDNKIMSVNMAINDPLDANAEMTWRGQIDYNQFMDQHRRLRNMEIQNLKTSFTVRKVLYQDGTVQEF